MIEDLICLVLDTFDLLSAKW